MWSTEYVKACRPSDLARSALPVAREFPLGRPTPHGRPRQAPASSAEDVEKKLTGTSRCEAVILGVRGLLGTLEPADHLIYHWT